MNQTRMRQARIVSGIILFFFLITHFTNHALGLAGLEMMERGGQVFRTFWRFPAVAGILYVAAFAHLVLVVIALFRRSRLDMPIREWLQIVLGFSIPFFMATHVSATLGLHQIFGIQDSYAYVLSSIWIAAPVQGALLSLGLVAAWTHGLLGMHFWLRLKPWYGRAYPWLAAAALALPILALCGFVAGGRDLGWFWDQPGFRDAFLERLNWPGSIGTATAYGMAFNIRVAAGIMLTTLLLYHGWRVLQRRREAHAAFQMTYADGRKVTVANGLTVLEASRAHKIAHASVCGGRGRCSTCRIRVIESATELPDPAEGETGVLKRVGAAPDVRLACQLRPLGNLTISQMFPADVTMAEAFEDGADGAGSERVVAVMFADLRGFTTISESKLPYDVVFLINQYDRAMGQAIEGAGGHVDKFIGDGVMALFGVRSGPEEGCRQALVAAREMGRALTRLNETLAPDLEKPLRMGIGVHVGPVIVGKMGYGQAAGFTVVGDTVNTASRMEGSTKEFGTELVISEAVIKLAGADLSDAEAHDVALRGKDITVAVRTLKAASDLII